MTQARAAILEAPRTLSVHNLELQPFEAGNLSFEGPITHTVEPGRVREAREVAFGDPQCPKQMIDRQA